jgi:hypothetical protein
MDLSPLELAVHRLRDAETAADAARADVELESVLAVRAGADIDAVSGLSGITRTIRWGWRSSPAAFLG